MAVAGAVGMRYSEVIRPKALLIKVALAFFGAILASIVATPVAAWLMLGSPDDGSHGFMIPVLLSGRVGLPVGILLGTVIGLFLVLKAKRKSSGSRTGGIFEKYNEEE